VHIEESRVSGEWENERELGSCIIEWPAVVEKHPIWVSTHVNLLLAIIHFDLRLINRRRIQCEILNELSNQILFTGIEQRIRFEGLEFLFELLLLCWENVENRVFIEEHLSFTYSQVWHTSR